MQIARVIYLAIVVRFLIGPSISTYAQSAVEAGAANKRANADPRDVLSADQWKRVDAAVDRALTWLAGQQQPDGSFPTLSHGQPGVTGLCLLAFLAHGHNPGEGKYGGQLTRAQEFILTCHKPNGLIAVHGPGGRGSRSPSTRS